MLADQLDLLDKLTHDYADRREEKATTKVAHQIQHDSQYLLSTGPVKERDAKATVTSKDELLAREIADALCDAAKEAMLSCRDRVSGYQTLLRAIQGQT